MTGTNESAPKTTAPHEIPIHDVLYEKKLGLRIYRVIGPSPEVVEGYRQHILRIVEILKTIDRAAIEFLLLPGVELAKNSGMSGSASGVSGSAAIERGKKQVKKRGDIDWIMSLLESGEMDERRLILLSIAILTGVNRSRGLPFGLAVLKMLKAEDYPLEQMFEKDGKATCIDVALLNKELAQSFGIKSDIYAEGNELAGHRFLVTETQEVIDGWSPQLFYLTFDEFRKNYRHNRFHKEAYKGSY